MFAAERTKVQTVSAIEPLSRWLTIALYVVAGSVLCGWLALVVLHLGDDYRVTHLQGVWLAVTEAARAGRLYPPMFDGEHYAGTRYMPLPILLNALASSVAGSPWIGGKLVAAFLMAVLLALVVVVLRRRSCPWPLTIALAATIVATDTGLQAGTAIGGDLLAVVLQIGALSLVVGNGGRKAIATAGVLAGLALASKLTGVWAFLAVTSWFVLNRDRRSAAIFAGASAIAAAITLGAVELVTRGGLSQHLLVFSVAGIDKATSLLRGPNQVLYNLVGHASAAVVLVPLVILGVLLSSGWRQLSVFQIAWGCALLLLMVVYADVGTGFNQLLDVVVLTAIAAGDLAGRAARRTDGRVPPAIVLAVAASVLWAAGVDLVRTVGFDLRSAVAASVAGRPARRAVDAATRIVTPENQVFAEDPAIYVALGRQPVVMDPFMLTRLDRIHPELIDPLITRIMERRFDLVLLVVSLDDRSVDYWWTDFHYGTRVAAALRKSYRADGMVGRYFLYRPRS